MKISIILTTAVTIRCFLLGVLNDNHIIKIDSPVSSIEVINNVMVKPIKRRVRVDKLLLSSLLSIRAVNTN
jgi:hypothetical protein